MATSLPEQQEFIGNEITEGDFKIALVNMLSYLIGLLGKDGEISTARKTLQVPLSAIAEKTADYTARADDTGKVLRFTGGTAITLSLDAATALGAGWNLTVINDTSSTVTISPYTGEVIDGASSLVVGASLRTGIVCDGTRLMTTYKQEEPETLPGKGARMLEGSGVFKVPDGVTGLRVWCIGGGGGGNHNSGSPGDGGNTTFGTYITAYGGKGAPWGSQGSGGAAGYCSQGNYVTKAGESGLTRKSYIWAPSWVETTSGNGQSGTYSGGGGSSVFAVLSVTPEEEIQFSVGAGGWASHGSGNAGFCYVEW